MDTKIIDFNKFKCMENYCISDIPELSEKLKDSYIGIVDAYGLESIQKADSMTLKELAQMIFCLDLRAKANSHRNAVFYLIKVSNGGYKKIIKRVQDKDFIGAGILIFSILNNKK